MTCITMWDTVYQMKNKNIPLSHYFISIISINHSMLHSTCSTNCKLYNDHIRHLGMFRTAKAMGTSVKHYNMLWNAVYNYHSYIHVILSTVARKLCNIFITKFAEQW